MASHEFRELVDVDAFFDGSACSEVLVELVDLVISENLPDCFFYSLAWHPFEVARQKRTHGVPVDVDDLGQSLFVWSVDGCHGWPRARRLGLVPGVFPTL